MVESAQSVKACILAIAGLVLFAGPGLPAATADDDPPNNNTSACPVEIPFTGTQIECAWNHVSWLAKEPLAEGPLVTVFIGECDYWFTNDPNPTLTGIPCVAESASGCTQLNMNDLYCWRDTEQEELGRAVKPANPLNAPLVEFGSLCVIFRDADGDPHGGNIPMIVPAALPMEDLSTSCG